MADLRESMWNIVLQTIKILHLHYHIAYGHQTWQSRELPEETPFRKVTGLLRQVVLQDYQVVWSCNLKTFYLHYQNAYGHQSWQGGDLP